MKNKEYILKHIIVVGVSIVALILAFYMPYLSFKYEDYKLKDYMNPVEMKSADLESNKILLAEKLEAALSNGLNPNSYISVDIDQYNTDTRQANLDYNSAWEIGKDVLVHNFVRAAAVRHALAMLVAAIP